MIMKSGWNVGESFNLVFLAHGGEFFKPGTAEPTVNSAAGIAALNTLKALVEYAHPDHLTQASNETQAIWEAGEAALGIMWGSRGSVILDDEGSSEQVTSNTVLSSAHQLSQVVYPVRHCGGMVLLFRKTYRMQKQKLHLPLWQAH